MKFKNIFIIVVLLFSSLQMTANNDIIDKISELDDVTSVFISKPMLGIMNGIMNREKAGGLDIGSIVSKLNSITILTGKNPTASSVMRDHMKALLLAESTKMKTANNYIDGAKRLEKGAESMLMEAKKMNINNSKQRKQAEQYRASAKEMKEGAIGMRNAGLALKKKVNKGGYEQLMKVKEKDSKVDMYVKMKGEIVTSFLMTVDEKSEFVIIHLDGNIPLDEIQRLTSKVK